MRDKGKHYEQMAWQWLQQQGLQPVVQNYHCRRGEVDLILLDGDTLCFIEVKYRKSNAFGGVAYSIGLSKQRKIVHTAQHFIEHHSRFAGHGCRFDALFITPPTAGHSAEHIEWIKNAFSDPSASAY